MSAKVRVLFLVSNPCKDGGLALDEEARAVAEKIRSTDHRDVLDLITAWAVRPDDLQSLLMRHRPHIVHFSGHGTRGKSMRSGWQNEALTTRDMIVTADDHGPELVLASEGGATCPINTEILVDLFSVLKDNVFLLILNACHSAETAQELSDVVPFSIGMDGEISDQAAIAFAGAFYQALGYGRDIQAAFDLGRNALMLLQNSEERVPRLYWRRNQGDPAKAVVVGRSSTAAPPCAVPSLSAGGLDQSPVDDADKNLLHIMWEFLDENLQDAFSLAYNKKRRQGGNRISTKDFFQALVRLDDDCVKGLLGTLPVESLPGPLDQAISSERRLVLQESPLLSDCVADSLEHFKELPDLPRKLSPADLFVDIAVHGHGESVSRLRMHGIGAKQIEERVRKLGLPVLRRAQT